MGLFKDRFCAKCTLPVCNYHWEDRRAGLWNWPGFESSSSAPHWLKTELTLSVGKGHGQPVQKITAKTSALVKHCQVLPVSRRHSIQWEKKTTGWEVGLVCLILLRGNWVTERYFELFKHTANYHRNWKPSRFPYPRSFTVTRYSLPQESWDVLLF